MAGLYGSIDDARLMQHRFDSQSLVGELVAGMGQWGLHHARSHSDVEYFLQQGAPIDGVKLIDWRDGHQHWETPLLTAFVDRRAEVASALLQLGAAPDAPNAIGLPGGGGFGHTVLHTLAMSGESSAVATLVAAGADVNRQTTLGWTPLHFAAQNDAVDVVLTLLRVGADPGLCDLDGERPIHVAGPDTRALLA